MVTVLKNHDKYILLVQERNMGHVFNNDFSCTFSKYHGVNGDYNENYKSIENWKLNTSVVTDHHSPATRNQEDILFATGYWGENNK